MIIEYLDGKPGEGEAAPGRGAGALRRRMAQAERCCGRGGSRKTRRRGDGETRRRGEHGDTETRRHGTGGPGNDPRCTLAPDHLPPATATSDNALWLACSASPVFFLDRYGPSMIRWRAGWTRFRLWPAQVRAPGTARRPPPGRPPQGAAARHVMVDRRLRPVADDLPAPPPPCSSSRSAMTRRSTC